MINNNTRIKQADYQTECREETIQVLEAGSIQEIIKKVQLSKAK